MSRSGTSQSIYRERCSFRAEHSSETATQLKQTRPKSKTHLVQGTRGRRGAEAKKRPTEDERQKTEEACEEKEIARACLKVAGIRGHFLLFERGLSHGACLTGKREVREGRRQKESVGVQRAEIGVRQRQREVLPEEATKNRCLSRRNRNRNKKQKKSKKKKTIKKYAREAR